MFGSVSEKGLQKEVERLKREVEKLERYRTEGGFARSLCDAWQRIHRLEVLLGKRNRKMRGQHRALRKLGDDLLVMGNREKERAAEREIEAAAWRERREGWGVRGLVREAGMSEVLRQLAAVVEEVVAQEGEGGGEESKGYLDQLREDVWVALRHYTDRYEVRK